MSHEAALNKLKNVITFEFDHVGIAVNSLSEGQKFYSTLGLGADSSSEEVTSEKVRVQMFELANSCRIELLEPTSDDSTIAKFLKNRGPGIHHICLRVSDIHTALTRVKEAGLRLVHEKPFRGAHDCDVAFVHPAATGGVLIELSEYKGKGKSR